MRVMVSLPKMSITFTVLQLEAAGLLDLPAERATPQ